MEAGAPPPDIVITNEEELLMLCAPKPLRSLIIALLLCQLCLIPVSRAASYEVNQQDGNWCILCSLEAPASFEGELYQYQYTQQKANMPQLREQLSTVYQGNLQADTGYNPSFVFSDAPLNFSVPAFVSQEAIPTPEEQETITRLMQAMNSSDFHSADQPFLCASLETMLSEFNENTIGLLFDWERYAQAMRNGNQTFAPAPEDLLVVLVPEINGYPILPMLKGSYSDADVPMYVKAVLQQSKVGYLEIGCSYQIVKQRLIESKLIDWQTAIDTALNHGHSGFKSAFDAMATLQDAHFDYPAFFAAYQPSFALEADGVRACYYASSSVLRPAWQVNLTLSISLQNDAELTPQERHAYLPEKLRICYIVDAMTGEIV